MDNDTIQLILDGVKSLSFGGGLAVFAVFGYKALQLWLKNKNDHQEDAGQSGVAKDFSAMFVDLKKHVENDHEHKFIELDEKIDKLQSAFNSFQLDMISRVRYLEAKVLNGNKPNN